MMIEVVQANNEHIKCEKKCVKIEHNIFLLTMFVVCIHHVLNGFDQK